MSGKAALQLVAEVPLRPMTPAVVLFGRDDAGRPRAAWFDVSEAKLAAHAAEVMNLRVVQLADDEQRTFADQFTHGRLFGSGRAFIPYIRRELFPHLLELAVCSRGSRRHGLGACRRGWPAHGDARAGTGKAFPRDDGRRSAARSARPFVGHKLPRDRDEIGLGSIVLAHEGPDEGWWEAEVIGINGTVPLAALARLPDPAHHPAPRQRTRVAAARQSLAFPRPHPSHTGWLGCPAAGRTAPPLNLLPTFEAPMLTTVLDVDRTRALNDILRRSLSGGLLMLTAGVIALGRERQQIILDAIAPTTTSRLTTIPAANTTSVRSRLRASGWFFKIDYYDRAMTGTPRIRPTAASRRGC